MLTLPAESSAPGLMGLFNMSVFPIGGRDGCDAPVAEDEFQQDAGGRANEGTSFAKFRQLHLRIGDREPVELARHRLMVVKAKGDVIDRLTGPIDRAALARNEAPDRLAGGVAPVVFLGIEARYPPASSLPTFA